MIKSIRSDNPLFKEVHFKPGFNVILAERVHESSQKDSRNGLGKTTLIEIIHFCLGASTKKNEGLCVPQLENWTFILDISLKGKDYSIYRNTQSTSIIGVKGDFSDWPLKPQYDFIEEKHTMPVNQWTQILGYLIFSLPVEASDRKYAPSFRSLISYFIRRGSGGFLSPFTHHTKQKKFDLQVNNAFLLGLNWEYAAEFQVLKDKEKTLNNLKAAAGQGLLAGHTGTAGELEAEKINLQMNLRQLDEQLKSFKVHPQYFQILKEANRLTADIHELTNQSTLNMQIRDKYNESIVEEKDVSVEKVSQVYEEAGLIFPGELMRTLRDVSDFQHQLLTNRKDYLQAEVSRLSREINEQKDQITFFSEKRAELMAVLETHGALEEYVKLQERAGVLAQRLEAVKNRLENLKRFEEGKRVLRTERDDLHGKTRRDFEERVSQREKAITFFNRFSESLYSEPGILSIDIRDKGYDFGVIIKRSGSHGIDHMKVFCYDLMLAGLAISRGDRLGSLVHDSTLFHGVDERQVAKALELASSEAETQGFQYICALNTDMIPYGDFSEDFRARFDKQVVITFTDATDDGGLLGMRF